MTCPECSREYSKRWYGRHLIANHGYHYEMGDVPTPPTSKMIVCTTDGKPLTAEDQKQLEDYMAYRIAKAKRVRSGTPHRANTAAVERKPKATPTRDKGDT
jgi:hypothetical protein